MSQNRVSGGRHRGLLALLTFVNLLNYFDRYILVAVLPAIQKEFGLSDLRAGLLGTAFMVSYFLLSPACGWLGDRIHRFRLISAGVGVWSVATAASGLARSFPSLLAFRSFVGVGEASYVSVSPVLLGDLFAKNVRGRIFAIFFMAIPVGSALGYLIGGLLEAHAGWRLTLMLAGGPGLIVALILFFLKDPPRGRFDEENLSLRQLPLHEIAQALWRNRPYVYTVMGYIAYTFVVGGVSFWMPSYLLRFYAMDLASANMIFGGVTVVAGFLGTLAGGQWADYALKRNKNAYLSVSGISALIAAIVFILVLLTSRLWLAFSLIFVLEFFLFVSTSPVNAQLVNCVPIAYRATANAVCVFLIHLFGDAASPALIGKISDLTNLRIALWIGPVGIALAGWLWIYGARMSGSLKLKGE